MVHKVWFPLSFLIHSIRSLLQNLARFLAKLQPNIRNRTHDYYAIILVAGVLPNTVHIRYHSIPSALENINPILLNEANKNLGYCGNLISPKNLLCIFQRILGTYSIGLYQTVSLSSI